MQKSAVVDYWNDRRGYGFLAVTRSERYFFHVSAIIEGPIGDLRGLKATFDVVPATEAGKLPLAVRVAIESKGGAA